MISDPTLTTAAPVAIITGAGTGIGQATARTLAADGMTVVLVGRRAGPLQAVAEAVRGTRGIARVFPVDIRDPTAVDGLFDALFANGRVDVLVNNAGIGGMPGLVHELTDAEWEDLVATNVTGALRMTRHVLPHFVANRSGAVVNVASVAGLVGMPYLSGYSMTKSALIALTRSIAVEYGWAGVRANCVCPGTVETDLTQPFLRDPARRERLERTIPAGRIGSPEDIAECIRFLCSPTTTFVSGSVLTADGSYSVGGR